jgi:hypothetical protein
MTPWRQSLLDFRLLLELQLGSRLFLFAVVDLVLLGSALFNSMVGGGEPASVYLGVVILPLLLLGVPALANVVALERSAGSLDLALSVPDTERYFLRRSAAVCGLMTAQAWAVLLALWLVEARSFPLLPPLLQSAALAALLGAVVLFWAVRVQTAGGVWFSTLVTVALLGRWFFANPVPLRGSAASHPWIGELTESLEWAGGMVVLLLGAGFFFLHARRRLRRPERMLA